MSSRVLLTYIAFVLLSPTAQGQKKFLGDLDHSALEKLNGGAFNEEILSALGPMLGCGDEADSEKVELIKQKLEPMWRSLPKISGDRIERRLLRYLAHRYFMQTSSLMVRGFEPNRIVNESHWGVADILSQSVPAYVEAVLHAKHDNSVGFSFTDATHMILMVDQLILDSESTLLEKVYKRLKIPTHLTLTQRQLTIVLHDYLAEWIVEGDDEDMEMLFANRTLIREVLPNFAHLMFMARGGARALQWARLQNVPRGGAQNAWNEKYTFEDVHSIVADITQRFASYWIDECDSMKDALTSYDTYHTGRVPLSKLYSTVGKADFRFSESEAYLRDMGALDDSSSYLGPQVIIPNYLQAVSNCIVTTAHYLVCCKDGCEEILGNIEVHFQASTASAKDILDFVGNMTVDASLDEEYKPQIDAKLTKLLEDISTASGGMVPLHGRLFSQWLHYAFPRECPFPHKLGVVSTVTPSQYGEVFIASDAEMQRHQANIVNHTSLNVTMHKDAFHWMSQWSDDEELMVAYSSDLGVSWQRRLLLVAIGLTLLACGIGMGTVIIDRTPSAKSAVGNDKFYV